MQYNLFLNVYTIHTNYLNMLSRYLQLNTGIKNFIFFNNGVIFNLLFVPLKHCLILELKLSIFCKILELKNIILRSSFNLCYFCI